MCVLHTSTGHVQTLHRFTQGPRSPGEFGASRARGSIPVDTEGQLYKEYSRSLSVQRVKDTWRVRTNIPVMAPFQRKRMQDFRKSLKRGCWEPELKPVTRGRRGPHVLSVPTPHPPRSSDVCALHFHDSGSLGISQRKGNLWREYWVLDRHFSKGDVQTTNKHLKRCPTSLIIWKIKLKARRYQFAPTRSAIVKTRENNKC